jgi:alkanesulfonate monooxygenase SsuD/methylene tetrahydromethanopterin reductase-like flavin-dependent oxidoreductase (luciferase family)
VRTHWEVYEQAWPRAGAPDRSAWRVAKTICVGDDDAATREYAFGPRSPYRHYYGQLGFKLVRAGRANLFKDDPSQPDESVTTDLLLDRLVIAGEPSRVVEELLAFREQIGDFGTLLYCGVDWVDPGIARRSLELMAEAVLPEVNRAIGEPAQAAAG